MPLIDDDGRPIDIDDDPYAPEPGSDPEGDEGGGGETADDGAIPTIDASKLPFRFNPPLHPQARHYRTDLGLRRGTPRNVYDDPDQLKNEFASGSARRTDQAKTTFEKLRLGRIVQGDIAVSAAMLEANQRYGIRFLYNPPSVSGGLNVGNDFIPDQQSSGAFVLQTGLENIAFQILLNRIPDIQGKAKRGDYLPEISKEDRDQIQERGTHYDVEFLYRCANGTHSLKSRTNTGDIGVLLPNPCNLILGPFTSKGAITTVQVQDQMFSRDMVPMLSYVSITFTRFLATNPSDTDALSNAGISGNKSDDDSSGGSPSEGPGYGGGTEEPKPGRGALSGKAVYDLAKSAGFSPTLADKMTQIAWKESGWNPNAYNGNRNTGDKSYGLWQINMIDSLGPERRRQFHLKKNEDLFYAPVNARAAYGIWKGSGLRAWSTYKNGSYRDVKITWR